MTGGGRRAARGVALGVSALVTALFLVLTLAPPRWARHSLELWEKKTLDLRLLIHAARSRPPAEDAVVVVAIDERSLTREGRWPWSRNRMAGLIEALARDRPAVIGVDILFPEAEVSDALQVVRTLRSAPDLGGGAGLREKLAGWEREFDADTRLARAVAAAGNVVLPVGLLVPVAGEGAPTGGTAALPTALVSSAFGRIGALGQGKLFAPVDAERAVPPIPPLDGAARALGSAYLEPDRDGVSRWEYLAVRYRDEFVPSFALQVARLREGLSRMDMRLQMGTGVALGKTFIPTDERGRMLIDYGAGGATFRNVSATDVLRGRVPAGTFTGKAVLVGTTALGTYDRMVTPLSANAAGVERNAAVVRNILTRRFLRRTDSMALLDAALIALYGALLWAALTRLRAGPGAAVAGGLLGAHLLLAQYLFEARGLWIGVVYPAGTIGLSYVLLTLVRFVTEERGARELRRMFASYLAPAMVDQLVRNPELARLGGARKELTVLFSDIRGFTAFAEDHPPEEVFNLLNEYMEAMSDVVFRWNGTLDKYVGDALMVFWGAPLEQPDHAARAVRCALEMRAELGRLQSKWSAEGTTVLDAGIGINTGPMVVGNMGAAGRKMDYTVIGDAVNVAARVESLTRQRGVTILVTEATVQAAGAGLSEGAGGPPVAAFHEMGEVPVKGRRRHLRVFAVEPPEAGP